jgi:malonyl-CoA/methylmalonyl-CoA synthetase
VNPTITAAAGATDAGPTDGNVFALFEAAARAHPERAFLIVGGEPLLTYGAMLAETARAGAWLRSLDFAARARMLVQVDKSPAAVILYLACLRVGGVFVPLNTAYQAAELAYFLADSDPALFVTSPGLAGEAVAFDGVRVSLADDLAAAPWAATDALIATVRLGRDDPAAILYTSGTTGRSKGAVLTHGNLASNVTVLGHAWQWRANDILLHALPFFHVHGLFVALHCAMLYASPIVFHARFDAAAVIRDLPTATVFMGVPTFYTRLLAEPTFDAERCRTVRVFISGSAPLLDATFAAFAERTGHQILERYGMTEALMVTSNPYDGPRVAGTVGTALPGIAIRVRDGVLQIKGPNLFGGYWRNPEKTAADRSADGWFITGDMATIDDDGVVRIVGRARDLIISGGYNIYPKEIELAIDAIPGVGESAVVGVAHPDFGEGVVAIVALTPGSDLEPAAIMAALATQLAAFKRPKRVFVVDDLPRNAMGKVQKADLRNRYKSVFA